MIVVFSTLLSILELTHYQYIENCQASVILCRHPSYGRTRVHLAYPPMVVIQVISRLAHCFALNSLVCVSFCIFV